MKTKMTKSIKLLNERNILVSKSKKKQEICKKMKQNKKISQKK